MPSQPFFLARWCVVCEIEKANRINFRSPLHSWFLIAKRQSATAEWVKIQLTTLLPHVYLTSTSRHSQKSSSTQVIALFSNYLTSFSKTNLQYRSKMNVSSIRFLQTSLCIVDDEYDNVPEIRKDRFWRNSEAKPLYSIASLAVAGKQLIGSAIKFK